MSAATLAGPYGDALDWALTREHQADSLEVPVGVAEEDAKPSLHVARVIVSACLHGDPFYVSRAIADILGQAAASIDDRIAIAAEIIPSPAGYLYFQRPIAHIHDPAMPGDVVEGIGWQSLYCDCCTANHRCDNPKCGTPFSIGPTFVYQDFPNASLGERYVDDAWACSLGVTVFMSSGINVMAPTIGRHVAADDCVVSQTTKYLATAFEFMDQRIVTTERHVAARPHRRRYERTNHHEPPPVQVVMLRRTESHGGGDGSRDVDWQHQWVVRYHRRNQWYPKLGIHRIRWIQPYVKGDPTKPLLNAEKLFAVVR